MKGIIDATQQEGSHAMYLLQEIKQSLLHPSLKLEN